MRQDLLKTYALPGGDFIRQLRADETHQFFNFPMGVDPASVAALELNHDFLVQLTATFAPEPVYPHHGIFQASCLELVFIFSVGHTTTLSL